MSNFETMTREERMNAPEKGKVDLRSYARRRMSDEGISIRAMARALGVQPNNLGAGLRGTRSLPLEWMETILWVLDGEKNF